MGKTGKREREGRGIKGLVDVGGDEKRDRDGDEKREGNMNEKQENLQS